MRIESAQSETDIQVPRCPAASRNSDGDKWCESRGLIRSYQYRRHNGRSSPPLPRRHSDCRNSCWDHCASDPRSNAPTSWLHRALPGIPKIDRKSTRLNSSHLVISYAVFCLKKKNTQHLNVGAFTQKDLLATHSRAVLGLLPADRDTDNLYFPVVLICITSAGAPALEVARSRL